MCQHFVGPLIATSTPPTLHRSGLFTFSSEARGFKRRQELGRVWGRVSRGFRQSSGCSLDLFPGVGLQTRKGHWPCQGQHPWHDQASLPRNRPTYPHTTDRPTPETLLATQKKKHTHTHTFLCQARWLTFSDMPSD